MNNRRQPGFFDAARQEIAIDGAALRRDLNEHKLEWRFLLIKVIVAIAMFNLFFSILQDRRRRNSNSGSLIVALGYFIGAFYLLGLGWVGEDLLSRFKNLRLLRWGIKEKAEALQLEKEHDAQHNKDEALESLVEELSDELKEELSKEGLLEKQIIEKELNEVELSEARLLGKYVKLIEKEDGTKMMQTISFRFSEEFYSYSEMSFIVDPVEVFLFRMEQNNETRELKKIIDQPQVTEIQSKLAIKRYLATNAEKFEKNELSSFSRSGYRVDKNIEPREATEAGEKLVKYKKDLECSLSKKIKNFSEVFKDKCKEKKEIMEKNNKLILRY